MKRYRETNIILEDEELDALAKCVGFTCDDPDAEELKDAIHSLIGSAVERQNTLLAAKKEIKSLEEEHKCLIAEQKAKYEQENSNCKSELKNMCKANEALHHELDVYKAKIEMIYTIFGRGAR